MDRFPINHLPFVRWYVGALITEPDHFHGGMLPNRPRDPILRLMQDSRPVVYHAILWIYSDNGSRKPTHTSVQIAGKCIRAPNRS